MRSESVYIEQGIEKWKNKQQLQGAHLRSNFLIIGSLKLYTLLVWIGMDAKSDKVQHVDQLGKETSFFIKPENSSNE